MGFATMTGLAQEASGALAVFGQNAIVGVTVLAEQAAKMAATEMASGSLVGRSMVVIYAHPVAVASIVVAVAAIFTAIYYLDKPRRILNAQVRSVDASKLAAERAAIKLALNAIPITERNEVIAYAKRLFSATMPIDVKLSMIQKIGQVAQNEREDFVSSAEKVFTTSMRSSDRLVVVDAFDRLSFSHKLMPIVALQSVIDDGLPLLDGVKSAMNRLEILSVLVPLSTNERKNLIQAVQKIFTPLMSGGEKLELIQFICENVSPDEIDDLTTGCENLFRGKYILKGLKLLNGIPKKERKEFTDNAALFLDSSMDGSKALLLLEKFEILSKQQRQEFKDFASQVKFLESVDKFNLFLRLKNETSDEKKEFLDCLKGIFIPKYTYGDAWMFSELFEILPSDERKDYVTLVHKILPEQADSLEAYDTLKMIAKMSLSQRNKLLGMAEILFSSNTPLTNRIILLKLMLQVREENRDLFIKDLHTIFVKRGEGMLDRIMDHPNSVHLADIVHHFANFLKGPQGIKDFYQYRHAVDLKLHILDSKELITEFLATLPFVPKSEREFFVQDFEPVTMLRLAGTDLKYRMLKCYLLSTKTIKFIIEEQNAQLRQNKYELKMQESLESKLFSPNTPPLTLIKLSEFVLANKDGFWMLKKFVDRAEQINLCHVATGPKYFATVFENLEKLAEKECTFKPQAMTLFNQSVAINLNQLKRLNSSSVITRDELPPKATRKAWDELIKNFKIKVTSATSYYDANIKTLGTSWAAFSKTVYHDERHLLTSLLDLSGETVSEIEAKWRAVLNNILDKNKNDRRSSCFTEQEEVLISTIGHIQSCEEGRIGGITVAYQDLEEKYRYKVELSAPMDAIEVNDQRRKNNLLEFLEKFTKTHSTKTKEPQVFELLKLVNRDLGFYSPIVACALKEQHWIETENGYELNRAGATALIDFIEKDRKKPDLLQFFNINVQKIIEREFSGTNDLMHELTNTPKNKTVAEAVHQATYLKNLIGPVMGFNLKVDLHTGVIHDNLFWMDRDEALKKFFEHVTPKTMVEACVAAMNQATEADKKMLAIYVSEVKMDASKKIVFSQQDALDLLKETGYLT